MILGLLEKVFAVSLFCKCTTKTFE